MKVLANTAITIIILATVSCITPLTTYAQTINRGELYQTKTETSSATYNFTPDESEKFIDDLIITNNNETIKYPNSDGGIIPMGILKEDDAVIFMFLVEETILKLDKFNGSHSSELDGIPNRAEIASNLLKTDTAEDIEDQMAMLLAHIANTKRDLKFVFRGSEINHTEPYRREYQITFSTSDIINILNLKGITLK